MAITICVCAICTTFLGIGAIMEGKKNKDDDTGPANL